MKLRLVLRPAARADILYQFDYLMEQDAPGAAAWFLDAVEAGLERVREMPEIGSPRELDNPRLQGLRSWPVPGFDAVHLYYLVTDDAIRVIRVLHGKRDLDSILDRETG